MDSQGDRDKRGRFAKGNKVAKGNPHYLRRRELVQKVNDATSFEDIVAVMTKLRDLALGGDVMACRVYLERTMGRPPQQESPSEIIELPALKTLDDVTKATERILEAVNEHEIDMATAAGMSTLVESARRSIEAQQGMRGDEMQEAIRGFMEYMFAQRAGYESRTDSGYSGNT